MDGSTYIVLIEWDGKIPPRTFHNRMHSLGLRVRGTKDLPPLKRRAIDDGSVIAQEGAVVCASHSLARTVAAIALDEGAEEVSMGTVQISPMKMDTMDVAVLNRVQEILGRRGRPTGEKHDWIVTCHEEMRSYTVPDQYAVVNCPYCSGLKVYARPGTVPSLSFPASGDILSAWMRHRFTSMGQFEHPHEAEGAPEPPNRIPTIGHAQEAAAVEMMRNSAKFISQIERLPRNSAALILDAVLSGRVYATYDMRKEARVKAFIYLVEHNVDVSKVQLGEATDSVDILDAAILMTPQTAAQLWMAVN